MSSLRSTLQQFDVRLTVPPLSRPSRLADTRDALERTLGAVNLTKPSNDQLAATSKRLYTIADGRVDFDVLSTGDLRRTPWVIFEGSESRLEALASNLDFMTGYLGELIQRGSASAIAALVGCFLYFYPTGLGSFEALRGFLATRLLPSAGGTRNARWRACMGNCGVLEQDAPARLARVLADEKQPAVAVLEGCCLRGLLAGGGLVSRAFVDWIALVRRRLTEGLHDSAEVTRLIAFARHPDDSARLRFGGSRVPLAEGLLLPFSERRPDAGAVDVIKTFLLDVLGDPRLTRAKRWNGIDPQARQVMLSWLVKTTLQDFFRLLEYAAKSDKTAARHWRERKAFWAGYLEGGYIDDAWVVLGRQTQVDARDFLSEQGASYARFQRGAGVLSNHSALIMKIGGMTITEWSHSGKFRAWYPGNGKPPSLYRSTYSRDDLIRSADAEVIHHSRWQNKVADLIYDQTSVRGWTSTMEQWKPRTGSFVGGRRGYRRR